MKIFTRSLFSALLVGALLAVPAAAKDAKPSAMAPAAAQDKTLTVFAAASMKNALDEVDNAYTAKSGVKIIASYAASSALAKQIEQGAPADVFMSADTDVDGLREQQEGHQRADPRHLLGNSIVLIAPKDSKIDKVDHRPRL